ncbi:choice-of-anchor X domain-containing protein, partial [Streptococcus pneumoniae]|uniref:choice-of-anchor X domain-containing protein n=1 Tax=Streptococcus pneumoniae TaxID=1313 RepID=UPI0019514BC2
KVDPVRLGVTLSNRSLAYPNPINVYAEVRVGYFPVIEASVEATIEGPNQKIISIQLRDDGAFPDLLANDGVYSGSIIKLWNPERYSLTVRASSNGT